jgi:hypothetical protein
MECIAYNMNIPNQLSLWMLLNNRTASIYIYLELTLHAFSHTVVISGHASSYLEAQIYAPRAGNLRSSGLTPFKYFRSYPAKSAHR